MTGTSSLYRVTLVLGAASGGMGAHVKMIAAGLADRGIAVSVAGPSPADDRFQFSELPGASFSAVAVGERPRAGDVASLRRLRALLLADDAAGHVVHAHGLRAGALAVLALRTARGPRPAVVVTVHNAPPEAIAAGLVYRVLERVVARGADLVLCVSPDLERRLRAAGARRAAHAVIAAPGRAVPDVPVPSGTGTGTGTGQEPGATGGRPVVLAAGRLTAQKGLDVLLRASVTWRDLDPMPLVVIAGEGPLAGELRRSAVALNAPAVFLGHSADIDRLLAGAAVFVLPSRWEGQPLVLQEALRSGVPVVASRAGGVADLTGRDAALLVPPGDAPALAAAVRSVLAGPDLDARLRAAALARSAALPSPADAVDAALAAYESVGRRTALR